MNKGLISSLTLLMLAGTLFATFAVPSGKGIAYYINVTLTGSGGNYLVSNAVFNVLLNAGASSPYESKDLRNIYIFDGNSLTTVNSWIEGNDLNFFQTTSLSSSNNIQIWIQTSNAFVANGAVQVNDISIGFGPLTTNYMLAPGNHIGEAPYLTNSLFGYGAYDYAGNVFSYYTRFGGLSSNSLPSGWTYTGASSNIVDYANSVGLQESGSSEVGNSIWVKATPSANTVFNALDGLISQSYASSTNSVAFGVGNIIKSGSQGTSGPNPYNALFDIERQVGGVIAICTSHGSTSISFCAPTTTTGSNKANTILTAGLWKSSNEIGYKNYSSITVNAVIGGNIGSNIFVYAANQLGNAINITWIRTRPIPQFLNGNTLPIPSFAPLQAVPSTFTATITNPVNTILDVDQWQAFTTTAFNGVQTYVYSYNVFNTANKHTVTSTAGSSASSLTTNTFNYQTTSSDSGLIESANSWITDSSNFPVTPNSVNTITVWSVNSAPTAFLSFNSAGVSGLLFDSGQSYTATITPSGGSGYSANAPVTGGFQIQLRNLTGAYAIAGANILTWSPGNANSLPSNTITSITNNNQFTYCALVTDKGTTAPYVFNSVSNTITVNAALTSSLSLSNTILDAGQWTAMTGTAVGGTFPLTYNFFNTTGSTKQEHQDTGINARTDVFNEKSGATGTFTYEANILDSATTPVRVISSVQTMSVNSAPTVTVSASNTLLDSGQSVAWTATETSGSGFSANAPATGGFTFNFFNVTNSLAETGISNVLTWVPGQANTFATETVTSAFNNNVFTYNVVGTDKGTTSPYVFNSVGQGAGKTTITVNAVLAAAQSTVVNSILDAGQWESTSWTSTGGTFAYSPANIVVANAQRIQFISVQNTLSTRSNTLTFQTNSLYVGNILNTNVIITDSASTPVTANSVNSLPFSVNSAYYNYFSIKHAP